MVELDVKIPAGEQKRYVIRIGSDTLGGVWEQIEAEFRNYGKFIVTDENIVSAGYLEKLSGGQDIPTYVISPAGEISKNIETAVAIIESMEKAYLGRDTVVIALGGGTVGDIAGFAAAIFKRGVPVVQIPTTTVSQADSAVGGKTGVDSSVSKNAFGAFWHPAGVFIDVDTLKTLEDRQYRAGLVESVKHAIIADSSYFDFIEGNLDTILKRDSSVLERTAYYNCKIKGSVVEADPKEVNQRRMLNYGHTIGHAVEAASGYELLHGEAISIGIVAAGLIEVELGLGGIERLERVRNILKKIGMPVVLPGDLAENKLIELIKHDKKAIGKWPRFVLVCEIGEIYCKDGEYAVEVGQGVVDKVLAKLRN